jgi:hypothetical protein
VSNRRCQLGAGALGIAGAILLITSGLVYAQPRPAARLTVSSSGEQANDASRLIGNSRDSRTVLFASLASNLVAGDTNGVEDLFVRDRDVDRDGVLDEPGAVSTTRVSVGSGGAQADRPTTAGVLSRDGRFVLFTTEASTLVSGDTNQVGDVFLHDRDSDQDGVLDEPGAISTTRISEGAGGVQANAASTALSMTPDGRFVLFSSAASTLSSVPVGGFVQVYRKDRATGALTLVSSSPDGAAADGVSDMGSMSDDAQVVAFRSTAGNLGGGTAGLARAYFRDLGAGTLVHFEAPLPPNGPILSFGVLAGPGVAPDGATVYFSTFTTYATGTASSATDGDLYEFDRRTGARRRVAAGLGFMFGEDPRYIVFRGARSRILGCSAYDGSSRYDRVTGRTTTLVHAGLANVTAGGSLRRVLFESSSLTNCLPPGSSPPSPMNQLIDSAYGAPIVMPAPVRPGLMNWEGSEVIFEAADAGILPGGADSNGAADVFAVDLDSRLDQDADGLDDRWEAATGLSYTSGAGADGPDGNPDNDALTNLQEYQASSHPRGQTIHYLAEGAENAFFSTHLALANPTAAPATAVVRLLGDGGAATAAFVSVPAMGQRTLELSDANALPSASFSVVVESNTPLAIERTMSWDASRNTYGGHAERAFSEPSTTWLFAEGSTTGDFELFYLLQNPHSSEVTAIVCYLRPGGLPPIERTYILPAASRTTIVVKTQAPELASTDVSAAITADRPILAERSMYLTRMGQPFAAGHASAGVTAPATNWFFAEGATGAFFDLFLLLANSDAVDATVEVRYLLVDGEVLTKTYVVGANSRRTIWVNGEDIPGRGRVLANVDLSMMLTSTNGVGIVAERAMWFPGPGWTPAFWSEAHVSAGSTAAATRWVVADVHAGGPANTQTFVLVANTSAFEGRFELSKLTNAGASYFGTYTVPANSRTTIPIAGDDETYGPPSRARVTGERFGLLIESVGSRPPAQLVVERSTYWDAGGVVWAAGTNALATPIP